MSDCPLKQCVECYWNFQYPDETFENNEKLKELTEWDVKSV